MVEPVVVVEVISDPWTNIAQFGGIIAASGISIWTVRAQTRREERTRTRMLVSEYLAVANNLDDQILQLRQEVGPQRSVGSIGKPLYDTEVARMALEKYEPALADLKIKGAIAALHIDWNDGDYIREMNLSYEQVGDLLRDVATSGVLEESAIDLRQQTLPVNRSELAKQYSAGPPRPGFVERFFRIPYHRVKYELTWRLRGQDHPPGM